ncbi:hypothetical protein B0T10DRAFT_575566 [Thelonectria olida]|uniref:Zn(2)-C6 fungal-type domain-containing protein n=1 Tax=Thelonectria olida TaxID=1576542 RepID=A0A9P9AKE1_9HYPO|nr:hypothetical protein B0T10DRAFT_575566 [Thelonectria olida]
MLADTAIIYVDAQHLGTATAERNQAPPRRKSCLGCVRAKRRCDLGQPACQRCAQQNRQCRYHYSDEPRRLGRRSAGQSARQGPLSQALQGRNVSQLGSDMTVPLQIEGVFNFSQHDGLDDLLNIDTEPFLDPSSFVFGCSDVDNTGVFEPDRTVSATLNLIPPPPKQPSSWPETMSRTMVALRFQYAMDEIIRAPFRMAHENATPWCHPQVYSDDMPRSMQDAQACCALYSAKNPRNSSAVLRTIDARANELISTELPPSASALEVLARSQALLLYQIMRLFDNDVSTRAAAEQAMPRLEAATLELLQHMVPRGSIENGQPRAEEAFEPADLPLYPLSATQEFWSSWTLHESIRRTAVIAIFVTQLYARLHPLPQLVVCDRRMCSAYAWTGSAHLWRAEDAVDFAEAWRQRKHYVVTVSNLAGLLDEAEEDDIDVYGRMLLTALVGVKEMKGWFASKGGML